jgi:hypothetical protein
MGKSFCLSYDDGALIASAFNMASRLAADKMTPQEWERAQLILNDASMALAHGGINKHHATVICGCLEGVRRYILKDRLIVPSQRAAVVAQCDKIMRMLTEATAEQVVLQ